MQASKNESPIDLAPSSLLDIDERPSLDFTGDKLQPNGPRAMSEQLPLRNYEHSAMPVAISATSVYNPASNIGGFVPYNPSIIGTSTPPSIVSAHKTTLSTFAKQEESLPGLGSPISSTDRAPGNSYGARSVPNTQAGQNSHPITPESLFNPTSPQSIRSLGNDMHKGGQDASDEFYNRVQHLRGVFRLAAEKTRDIERKTVAHWVRVSAWWFLRGKKSLENGFRSTGNTQNSHGGNFGEFLSKSLQSYVDLAKSWWIVEEVLPNLMKGLDPKDRPETIDPFDGLYLTQITGILESLTTNMQAFAVFMVQRDVLPPPALLVQGADPQIWLEYPSLPIGVYALVARLDPRTLTRSIPRSHEPFFPILLTDTDRHFSYGRVFGNVEIVSEEGVSDDVMLPCIISIIREKTRSEVELTITSQDGQINMHIQSDRKIGPTWDDVQWKVKTHSLRVNLTRDLQLVLRLWEQDFKTLWGINDYIMKVARVWEPHAHEDLVFDESVGAFHYMGQPGTSTFPPNPIKGCNIRLFEAYSLNSESAGKRKIYAGHRLVAMTPPSTKTLSSVSQVFGNGIPTMYSNLRGDDNAPALLLTAREGGKKIPMVVTFRDMATRARLHSLLTGEFIARDEFTEDEIPLDDMLIRTLTHETSENLILASGIKWQHLRVINQGETLEDAAVVLSQRLRVCMTCTHGIITDRINIGQCVQR